MVFKKAGKGQRVFVVPLYAQRQCPQAAEDQPSVERGHSSTENNVCIPYLLNQGFTADQRAGDEIAMAAEIFGRAMRNHIDAKVQRTLIQRRGKGIVDQR